MGSEIQHIENSVKIKNRLTGSRLQITIQLHYTPIGLPVMNKINKINPIAKQLPKFGKRIVPDKRRAKEDKRVTKEVRDAKTAKD